MTQQANEKELVLGNKQLLGVFFVGTALCAVFFAMGYMVGRNSAKNVLPLGDGSAAAASVDTGHRQQPSEGTHEVPSDTTPRPNAEQPPPIATMPAQDPAGAQAAPVKEPVVDPTSARIVVTEPEAGASYLQVTALPRPDADNLIRTLRAQNFPAIVAASSKEALFRVLVGPYHQTAQLAEAKGRLKGLGFANAFVQRQ